MESVGNSDSIAQGSFIAQDLADQTSTAPSLILVPGKHEQLRIANVGRWRPVWKRRVVPAALVLGDFLLSLFIWKVASVLQGIWGQEGALWERTPVAMIAVITVWMGLCALLGLYPGYGLDPAEQLRRHTYGVFATLAILSIFALGFQAGHMLSRLLLAVVFLGLLVLTPFVRYLMKSWMKKMDLWGKPVVVLGYGEAGANVVNLLKEEWDLGYDPVAIFDYRLDAGG